jgi:hypothetical protein
MNRPIVSGLLGLCSVAFLALFPAACESGGVGDPCTPENEYNPQDPGFKLTEENIESRSFQCQTRICLVNHFQGRVSCPLGQPEPAACDPNGAPCAGQGEKCTQAAALAPECDSNDDCAGSTGNCNTEGKFCQCGTTADCLSFGDNFYCDAGDNHCKSYVCHTPGSCQNSVEGNDNGGKACCVPGSDTPITVPVCGQCDDKSKRAAAEAVYCSCRCGVAEGQTDDGSFNFCDCPDGFECKEIRPDLGLGDKQISGKYCIKEGTEYVNETSSNCGQVSGFFNGSICKGIGVGP